MASIQFADLANRTAEQEAARMGVAALDFDALSRQHDMIDVVEGDIRVRLFSRDGGFVVRAPIPLLMRRPALDRLLVDADNAIVGVFPTRSEAVTAALAFVAAAAAEG